MNQESNLQNNNEQTIQNTETPVAQTQNIETPTNAEQNTVKKIVLDEDPVTIDIELPEIVEDTTSIVPQKTEAPKEPELPTEQTGNIQF